MKIKVAQWVMLILLFYGLLTFSVNIRPAESSGTIYIRADGSIEGTDKIITADNVTYTFIDNINDSIVIRRDNIVVDGSCHTLQGNGIGIGIDLSGRYDVTIKNMKIKNFSFGIRLEGSYGNGVCGNEITENTNGVYFFNSHGNMISANNITANIIGIALSLASNNNIRANNITENDSGVFLFQSQNNEFGHNNLNNTDQVYSDGLRNTWNYSYPSGGNYWSDYTGIDDNGDGIGDTPYIINENNTDYYPLMNPWLAIHDVAIINWTIIRTVIADGCNTTIHPDHTHNYTCKLLTATLENQGDFHETFNVTAYALNVTELIIQKIVVNLTPQEKITLTFEWNTTSLGMEDHKFYTLKAVADTVWGETDDSDNNLTNGQVRVVIPGNVDGNEIVNMQDIYTELILRFMSEPGDPEYSPNADINCNGIINMMDIYTAILHFMETEPEDP